MARSCSTKAEKSNASPPEEIGGASAGTGSAEEGKGRAGGEERREVRDSIEKTSALPAAEGKGGGTPSKPGGGRAAEGREGGRGEALSVWMGCAGSVVAEVESGSAGQVGRVGMAMAGGGGSVGGAGERAGGEGEELGKVSGELRLDVPAATAAQASEVDRVGAGAGEGRTEGAEDSRRMGWEGRGKSKMEMVGMEASEGAGAVVAGMGAGRGRGCDVGELELRPLAW